MILVNDGGNDEETAICEEYAAAYPQIAYFRQENQGLSAARNTGLAAARGRWLMFVDSDDWVSPDFCRIPMEAAEKTGAQMVIFDLKYGGPDGQLHESKMEEGAYPSVEVLRKRLTGEVVGYVWNKLYRAELFKDIIFPVGEIWEDDAIMHILMDRAVTIAIIHDVLYYMGGHQGSITDIAFSNGEWARWVYIQRQKRYLYLKETHPELMDTENHVMTNAAAKYALELVKRKDRQGIKKVSKWLKENSVRPHNNSLKKRVAFRILKHMPSLFCVLASAGMKVFKP
ncbi:MAG: glycosyltransferase, partial [Ruminococcus sp.]|nr:glycosyltransferase [Ruminococcus sp.]